MALFVPSHVLITEAPFFKGPVVVFPAFGLTQPSVTELTGRFAAEGFSLGSCQWWLGFLLHLWPRKGHGWDSPFTVLRGVEEGGWGVLGGSK